MSKHESEFLRDELKVLIHQKRKSEKLQADLLKLEDSSLNAIQSTEEILGNLNIALPNLKSLSSNENNQTISKLKTRSWSDLNEEVQYMDDSDVNISELLNKQEIIKVKDSLKYIRADFNSLNKLDKYDYMMIGLAGTLASLVDIIFVHMPKNPGFLGAEGSGGGSLSNFIREKLNTSLTPAELSQLERDNWVPYDASHSKGLNRVVEGLGPRTHRFQTLGHDPILAFIFGVKDILKGEMTAIDKHGKIIIQTVNTVDKDIIGMNLFEAIGRAFGHLKSDIATKGGLPVPLMMLVQFLQFGKIGDKDYTFGQVTRMMYRSGYDFGHFISMSIPVMIIEVLVRVYFFIKSILDGKSIRESLPFMLSKKNSNPKLNTMLFTAHAIAASVNAGKIAVTQNPLSINYTQWLVFARYSYKEIKWVAFEKQAKQYDYVQKEIDTNWMKVHETLEQTMLLVEDRTLKL
ncbi:hypothetical protein QL992_05990 [Microbacterium sp. APC 3898]|uniref:Uncharacterized protein n=1 Tax=Planococcus notacanthi TaxID=3035188 RepID=A0ABT7ZN02_9BACL|nr:MULTISPECIES: hypothetical protein [Terrabacteria group]MDN3428541.1 hypothetical protein [Planococcus sp. APC 4016]MDN3498751.1 hypothetical protein [Microbacterium sp. APC 3898]